MVELTPGQADLAEKVTYWYKHFTRSKDPFTGYYAYSGAAGCGKTFVLKEIIRSLGLNASYMSCAYTGKAVLQLMRNDLRGRTIHSLIYDVVPFYKINPETGKKFLSFEFELKKKLDEDYDLIVVDEATMVNDDMVKEILSFGIPVIFVGDMNQLPPVFGKSTVMEKPNFVLTQIMRQKENDPIVRLSQMILKGIPLMAGKYGDSEVVRDFTLDESLLKRFDVVLCMTNKLRDNINTFCRKDILHYQTRDPRIGDKIICRQNNWSVSKDGFFLTNGSAGFISDIDRSELARGYYIIDFHPDFFPDYVDFEKLKVDSEYIRSDYETQKNFYRTSNEKFEYAYGLTVHLSQGSEYDRVLFLDSYFHDQELTRKAEYTAITRAKESVTIVLFRG